MSSRIFNKKYFDKRFLNDDKRVKSFESELQFIKNHISSGRLLDIGCSTGEMIEAFEWNGPCYGMETSKYAKTKAQKNGIKSPYSNPMMDHIKFLLKIMGVNTKFPFWKNSMDLLFEK